MLVVCRDNTSVRGGLLNVGQTYVVENIVCVDNQLYYELSGLNTLFCYWNFDVVSELRNDKLKELKI